MVSQIFSRGEKKNSPNKAESKRLESREQNLFKKTTTGWDFARRALGLRTDGADSEARVKRGTSGYVTGEKGNSRSHDRISPPAQVRHYAKFRG